MPCTLTVFDTESREKTTYVCDEDHTARMVEDDHAAGGSGEYADVDGKAFSIDWTRKRLVAFNRQGKAPEN